MIIDNRMDK